MKKTMLICSLALWFITMPLSVGAYTINDTGDSAYWGGTVVHTSSPTSYGDVIQGQDDEFEVDTLEAIRGFGGVTTVTITGAYFQSYMNMTGNAEYFAPGDLYISTTGWRVNDASDPIHYSSDAFTADEGWNYVVSFTEGKVYELDYTTITMTDDYMSDTSYSSWIYRADQAWRGGYGDYVSDATITLSGNTLSFTFEYLGEVDEMGYHWNMACGNDVVEGGGMPVPEPASLVLLGISMLGLGILRSRTGR